MQLLYRFLCRKADNLTKTDATNKFVLSVQKLYFYSELSTSGLSNKSTQSTDITLYLCYLTRLGGGGGGPVGPKAVLLFLYVFYSYCMLRRFLKRKMVDIYVKSHYV
jgi:hypothetical protein